MTGAQLEQTLGGPEGFFEPLKRGIGLRSSLGCVHVGDLCLR